MANAMQQPEESDFLFYTDPDGKLHIEVYYADKTVWLTQEKMAQLFEKSRSTINEHIKNIYAEGELIEADTLRKFGISEFSTTKPTNYYNLDVIISVGYRAKSIRGTRFRKWATAKRETFRIRQDHEFIGDFEKEVEQTKKRLKSPGQPR